MKKILEGIAFSALWASAAVVGKIGMLSVQPLLLFSIRFFLASALMLAYAYVFEKNTFPTKTEFKHLSIFGFLNVTLYLGCFIWALREVSAGIGNLLIATNPLTISLLSAIWLKRSLKRQEIIGILLGILGVALAVYPLLLNSYATLQGLAVLCVALIAYCIGTIYYAAVTWTLSRFAINGWQVFLGGIFMLPATLLTTDWATNDFDGRFLFSLLWLIFAVSVAAVQLWLRLLKYDTVFASMWLLVCPIFGFAFSAIFLNEPITLYTVCGTLLVMIGLYWGQRKGESK